MYFLVLKIILLYKNDVQNIDVSQYVVTTEVLHLFLIN